MEKKVIGVYAPANAAHIWFEEKYLFAKKQLENIGFKIVEGNLVKDKIYQGYRTASAKERAEEMMNLVKNKLSKVFFKNGDMPSYSPKVGIKLPP